MYNSATSIPSLSDVEKLTRYVGYATVLINSHSRT